MNANPGESGGRRELRRAYGALLGNFYERMYHQHIQLSAAASAFAADYPTAVDWQRTAIAELVQADPLQPFLPCLITDQGSAFLDPSHFVLEHWSAKIATFTNEVRASFAVINVASTERRPKRHYFVIQATDGFQAHWIAYQRQDKRFGPPTVQCFERQTPPWESDFLGPIARAIRETRDERGVAETQR
jgi:hypothetical protein